MQHRSKELGLIIATTRAKGDKGVKYESMVDLVATTVNPERARKYRLQRLKRSPSETSAKTVWEGQKAIARKYIDAAYRYGRIIYDYDPIFKDRYIFLGDPPETGGQYSKPGKW